MATLDAITRRIRAVLPAAWFPPALDDTPVLRAVLAMPAALGVWMADGVAYVRAQTRLRTATGGWLDMAGLDFLGDRIKRRAGQGDESFRTRLLVEVLRPRATRPAMDRLLFDLTDRKPQIIEPAHPGDTGAFRGQRLYYRVAGYYGSRTRPGEVFITVRRDLSTNTLGVSSWRNPRGGYRINRTFWVSRQQAADAIQDDDILAAMVGNAPEGITLWTKFSR